MRGCTEIQSPLNVSREPARLAAEALGWWWADAMGAIVVAVIVVREGLGQPDARAERLTMERLRARSRWDGRLDLALIDASGT